MSQTNAIVNLFKTLQLNQGTQEPTNVRIFGTPETPIFIAEDLAMILGIPERTWQKRVKRFQGPDVAFKARIRDENDKDIHHGGNTPWVLTELGVYTLFNSGKKQTHNFVRWLYTVAIPTLRQTQNNIEEILANGRTTLESKDYRLDVEVKTVKVIKKATNDIRYLEFEQEEYLQNKRAKQVAMSMIPNAPIEFEDLRNHQMERSVTKKLQEIEGGLCEVQVLGGRIDLLTETEVIEVKDARNFMAACGQVQYYYHQLLPRIYKKRIHLFNSDCCDKKVILEFVKTLDIKVTFEENEYS